MNPTTAIHYESVTLESWIKCHYGTVYEASKCLGKSETQLHRWVKAGARIDSTYQVWTAAKGGALLAGCKQTGENDE